MCEMGGAIGGGDGILDSISWVNSINQMSCFLVGGGVILDKKKKG